MPAAIWANCPVPFLCFLEQTTEVDKLSILSPIDMASFLCQLRSLASPQPCISRASIHHCQPGQDGIIHLQQPGVWFGISMQGGGDSHSHWHLQRTHTHIHGLIQTKPRPHSLHTLLQARPISLSTISTEVIPAVAYYTESENEHVLQC